MEADFEFKSIQEPLQIEQCWEIALLLRPNLDKEKWCSTVLKMIKTEKYKIAALFDEGTIVAFAGYKEMTSLHGENIIYIDELCTPESYRTSGMTTHLIEFINLLAIAKYKDSVVIAAGFSNATAHNLFLNHGFKLKAFQLAYPINVS